MSAQKSDHESVNLSQLSINQSALVVDVTSDGSPVGDGFKIRLEAMGLRKGQMVRVLRKAPGGDPYQVRVGSTTEIAIRKSEAQLVNIKLNS